MTEPSQSPPQESLEFTEEELQDAWERIKNHAKGIFQCLERGMNKKPTQYDLMTMTVASLQATFGTFGDPRMDLACQIISQGLLQFEAHTYREEHPKPKINSNLTIITGGPLVDAHGRPYNKMTDITPSNPTPNPISGTSNALLPERGQREDRSPDSAKDGSQRG